MKIKINKGNNMKKFLVVMIIAFLATPLFADGEGRFYSDERLTEPGNATLNVTLDLSDSQEEGDDPLYSVEVGFSAGADLSGFNEDSYAKQDGSYTAPKQIDSLSLILGESIAKGPDDLYVYWIIKSAQGITIDLAMPSALTATEDKFIDWTASWGDSKIIGGSSNYNEEGAQILDRTKVTAYGDVGAEKITVETGNILSAAPGTYTGTLKLIITASDASQSEESNN